MRSVRERFEKNEALPDQVAAFTDRSLRKHGLSESNVLHSTSLVRSVAELMAAGESTFIGVGIRKSAGNVVVRIVSDGPAYNPLDDLDLQSLLDSNAPVPGAGFDAPMPKEQLLHALRGSLNYDRRGVHNEIEYVARKAQPGTLKKVTAAFLLSILAGMLLRYFGGPALTAVLRDDLLTPIRTMFLNALKMLVVPVVFFSIASSMANVSDIREYGRIGIKVLLFYTFTSILAILVGFGVYPLLQPGQGASLELSTYFYTGETSTGISLLDTIVGIIPTSFVGAFTSMDMLQIIFLAVLTGAAANLLESGSDRQKAGEFLTLISRLFLKLASIVMRAVPLATFCAMTLLVLTIDTHMVSALLKLVLTMGLGVVCMFSVYSLLFLLFVRKNPAVFLKKCIPNFLSFITFCSTSAVMPQSLETCGQRLGISSRISSFSMPLGSTINMDGACVYLTLSILFLAAVYQVPMTAEMLLKLAVTTLILSMGAPPIAGAGFICLSILVQQVGLPIESLGLLMGIDQVMSMCRTLINGTGDFVGTAVVANSEGLMDMEIFDHSGSPPAA